MLTLGVNVRRIPRTAQGAADRAALPPIGRDAEIRCPTGGVTDSSLAAAEPQPAVGTGLVPWVVGRSGALTS